jgi:flagellar biosynthesis activator protein FlaF
MNAIAIAQNAYGANARTLKTPRDIEYDVLARITGRLQKALADTGPTAFPALAAAMHDNIRSGPPSPSIWPIPGTASAQLRARLFYLAEFVLQHTPKVLNGTAKADALVDINLSVMRGLRGQRAGA